MAEGAGRIPILDVVREAWMFLAAHWRLFLPAALIVAVVAQIGSVIALAGGASTDQRSLLADAVDNLMSVLPGAIAGVLMAAAVLRKKLRDTFLGPTGLAFGADEMRLIGVFAAFTCVLVPLGVLTYMVITAVVLGRSGLTPEQLAAALQDPEALTAAIGETGATLLGLFMILVTVAIVYGYTRLFMVNAATMGERRIVMFQSWSWSRGNVLRMLGAIMLCWLPAFMIDNVAFELGLALFQSLSNAMGNAAVVGLVFDILITFIAAMMNIPLIALSAILYRGLRPPDFVAR